MAIGQLADYKRFVDGGDIKLAVVVPSKQCKDLLNLLGAEGIEAVWPDEDGGFTDTTGGSVVA